MKIIALLTAKGTNTFARKNVLPVNGKPLLWYPATEARACSEIDDFFVSSDDDEILDIASSIGYKKIRRPAELATPDAQHIDTINHALYIMKQEYDIIPDILVVLMGNTVCLKKSWIKSSIDALKNDPSLTAVTPVYKAQDKHPYRARRLDENGHLVPYFDFPEGLSSNRQDLPENFFFCHNFWTIRLQNGIVFNDGAAPWKFMGNKVLPIVVKEGFDVHDQDDIKESEKWLIENIDTE